MFSSIKFNGIRWQQAPYFSAVTYSLCAILSAALISRFNDINFPAPYSTQYQTLTSLAPLHLETNVALLVVASLIWICDLFRQNPFPVWFEMSWSLVFGLLEVGNIVKAGMSYPEAHCTLNPAIDVLTNGTVTLARRDSATSDVVGTVLEFSPPEQQKIIVNAAQQVCANWTAEFVFFTICAITLLLSHFAWLGIVALRHRRSHPDYVLDPTPVPFVWDLSSSTATAQQGDIETASVTSTAVSSSESFDEKKEAALEISSVPVTVAVSLPRRTA